MYQWAAVGGITKRGIRGGRWIGRVGMTYGLPGPVRCNRSTKCYEKQKNTDGGMSNNSPKKGYAMKPVREYCQSLQAIFTGARERGESQNLCDVDGLSARIF